MHRYGQPLDYVAASLGVASSLAFALALPPANIVVGGLAVGAMVVAVGITLRKHFPFSHGVSAPGPSMAHRGSAILHRRHDGSR